MPIVGFNYNKIDVEKKELSLKDKSKNMQVKSNVNINEVKEQKLPTGKEKNEGLRIDFTFTLQYDPDLGHINLQGFIFYLDDAKVMKTIYKEWEKDKQLPQEVMGEIINMVLLKSNIKALYLSQEVNLPPHIQMPRVVPKQAPADNYIG